MSLSTLTLRRPDDFHVHLRDAAQMRAVVGATAQVFGRAIVMPNLKPPITTTDAAAGYRQANPGCAPRGQPVRAADDAVPHR